MFFCFTCAGWENRTPLHSLENCCFTNKLIPQLPLKVLRIYQKGRHLTTHLPIKRMGCYNNNMLTKLIATGIIFAMSFLGYAPNDYSNFLPALIKSIVEQNISVPTNNNLESTSSEKTQTDTQTKIEQNNQTKKNTTNSNIIKTKNISTQENTKIESTSTPENIKLQSSTNPTQPVILQNSNSQIVGKLLDQTSTINEKISASVVNVYCQAIRGSSIETVTGSAVQVDPSGVYLTNAHVAIYVMLSDTEPTGTVSCYIRESSPAKKIYEAKSVYIPSSWINSHTNAYKLGIELIGTGEDDYALIKRGNSNPNLKQSDFPSEWSSSLESSLPTKGQNIILSGYPVFDKSIISSALYLMTNNSSILNAFNLNGKPDSLFDNESTKLAQIGSSGGGAFDLQGNLFGIMDAAINNTPGELPSERIVGINYIRNNILKDTGKSLESIISNAEQESKNFIQNYAPSLSKVLISNQ